MDLYVQGELRQIMGVKRLERFHLLHNGGGKGAAVGAISLNRSQGSDMLYQGHADVLTNTGTGIKTGHFPCPCQSGAQGNQTTQYQEKRIQDGP